MTPERDGIDRSLLDGLLCSFWFEAARCDQFAFEEGSEVLRSNRSLVGMDYLTPADARFYDVEICQTKLVQAFTHIRKEGLRIGVRHAIPSAAWANAHGNTVGAPHRNQRRPALRKECCGVFHSPAVFIGALVAAILKKLIHQIAVSGVQCDALKSGIYSALDTPL